MSNGNRLSIPELEDQIAALQRQLRDRNQERRRVGTDSMYVCVRCGCLYQSIWGCGCPLFHGEKRQAHPPAEGRPEWCDQGKSGYCCIGSCNFNRTNGVTVLHHETKRAEASTKFQEKE